jgi:hypothetical protein
LPEPRRGRPAPWRPDRPWLSRSRRQYPPPRNDDLDDAADERDDDDRAVPGVDGDRDPPSEAGGGGTRRGGPLCRFDLYRNASRLRLRRTWSGGM